MMRRSLAVLALTAAGTYGTVMVAGNPDDVGREAGVFPSLPFSPAPALLIARWGDLTIRVAFPTTPVCRLKTGGSGRWDVLLSARMSTTSGQYVTVPVTIRID